MRTIRTLPTHLLILWVALAWAALPPAAAAALGPEQRALIVNTADPYRVEVGAYFARRRSIPPARLPATVQALALA